MKQHPSLMQVRRKRKKTRKKKQSHHFFFIVQPAALTPLTPHIQSRVSPYETISDIMFAKVLRRAGLRRFQGDAILGLLKDEGFDPKALSFHSVSQLHEMQRKTSNRSVSCFSCLLSFPPFRCLILSPLLKKRNSGAFKCQMERAITNSGPEMSSTLHLNSLLIHNLLARQPWASSLRCVTACASSRSITQEIGLKPHK